MSASAANEAVVVDSEALVLAVAAILLERSVAYPGCHVHLRPELERRGIWADRDDVRCAVRKLQRRYGWVVDSSKAGHMLVRWPYRFKRQRSQQLSLLRRDRWQRCPTTQ